LIYNSSFKEVDSDNSSFREVDSDNSSFREVDSDNSSFREVDTVSFNNNFQNIMCGFRINIILVYNKTIFSFTLIMCFIVVLIKQ